MIIRPAVKEDLNTLAELTRDALSFASSPDPYAWQLEDPALKKRLESYLDSTKGSAFVLEVEGSIAGFVASHFDEFDPRKPDKGAIIDLLAVEQQYRSQGFGTHLVRELLLRLPEQGITSINVNVIGSSDSALRFWRRVGFRELAVTMSVELNPQTE